MVNEQDVKLTKCPHCGQKLFKPIAGNGNAKICIKCRRCRSFSTWKIVDGIAILSEE